MGAKVAAQANPKTTTMSKDCFIAVSLFRSAQNPCGLIEGVDIRRWFQPVFAGRENGFVQWDKSFRGSLTDETTSQDREAIRHAEWRDLDRPASRQDC